MARTLPDRRPPRHLGFTGIGLGHQRPVPQHPMRLLCGAVVAGGHERAVNEEHVPARKRLRCAREGAVQGSVGRTLT